MKNGQLEAYNDVMRDYIERGVLKELSQEEMDDWNEPVNFVPHHGIPKPRLTTTTLRVDCNSSLGNNNRCVSYNDLLPKVPKTLVLLLQALITWRTHNKVDIWGYVKIYNIILIFAEDMHMRRLIWCFNPAVSWTTYEVDRIHLGGHVATIGLEAAQREVATLTGHEPANEEKGVKRKESVDQKGQEMDQFRKALQTLKEKMENAERAQGEGRE